MGGHVTPGQSQEASRTLLAATGTGAGASHGLLGTYATFQATADGSHTGTTSVDIQVSNDGVQWITMGSISVTGNDDTDGFASNAAWKMVRANCTAHGDSTNVVTVTMGG